MLNFRNLRRDFPSSVIQAGAKLLENKAIVDAKISYMDNSIIKIEASVNSLYNHVHHTAIEIDRVGSALCDSSCDCTQNFDCVHVYALVCFLEENFNEMVVTYSKESDNEIEDNIKLDLKEIFQTAVSQEEQRKDLQYQKSILNDYVKAAYVLQTSPFFVVNTAKEEEVELFLVFVSTANNAVFAPGYVPELQLVLKLKSRPKPCLVTNLKSFFHSIKHREPLVIGEKKYLISSNSFSELEHKILLEIEKYIRFLAVKEDRDQKTVHMKVEDIGEMFSSVSNSIAANGQRGSKLLTKYAMPHFYVSNLEEPVKYAVNPAKIKMKLEYLTSPAPVFLLNPLIELDNEIVDLKDLLFLESEHPGVIYKNTYYRFLPHIRRAHLKGLNKLKEITIPEPLFGSFIEYSLPVLFNYTEVVNLSVVEKISTLPYSDALKARCVISYLDNELEVRVFFIYNKEVPFVLSQMEYKNIASFVAEYGIEARNLVEEKKLVDELLSDFTYDERDKLFKLKGEKKIVEFMSEVVPRFKDSVSFEYPSNLAEQFLYNKTEMSIFFRESKEIDSYEIELCMEGHLKSIELDALWECISNKKRYIELEKVPVKTKARSMTGSKHTKYLIIDFEQIEALVQIFSDLGFTVLDNIVEKKPLWSLTSVQASAFEKLNIKFHMTDILAETQRQIRGESEFKASEIPSVIQADLRKYQVEGVNWLERLRSMHLNGILADDMGLGKTLQAISAITQSREENQNIPSLVVCPTSLVYNWQSEFKKFNPELTTVVVEGTPQFRKKQIASSKDYDVVITSYNLLQKDVEYYSAIKFNYLILDEAHHIKNRTTRNAKSVKSIASIHRLILTGTPIENSLEELWSLFDFLMPGLLGSYDRFVEKYIRSSHLGTDRSDNMEFLKRKVSPFILRRMKDDVLEDLPPVSEILYHCHLTETQRELYHSYAASAKDELSRLVEQEGFDRIRIHILAMLTRLKQICCHPAIFAKDKIEAGDSAKYDMLMELIPSLIEGQHKTVIFSQYTKMLNIIKNDLTAKNIPFAYLDGTSKNRMGIVNEFNENPNIPIFLVSLKAGGSGLNLVGADTVIHYDMWWNPAVENQATDRVRRIGQKKSVSSYKMVTLNTIEEKILDLQNRKQGLVKKVICSDDEVISKLTWEEVLELLQT